MRGGALGLVLMLFGCNQRTPHSVQLDALERASPAEIAAPAVPAEKPASRVITVRVLVDDDYGSQVLHPDESIRAQFLRASRYTAAAVDARFEVTSIETWPHRQGVTELRNTVDELAAYAKDDGADLVVAFVSGLSVIERRQDALGSAALLGRHVVLRGFSDALELSELRRNMRALSDDELLDFYKKRRQHMETVLLLHEWAHTLGAPHDTERHSFLQAEYQLSMDSYSDLTRTLVHATLSAREARMPLSTQARVVRERIEAVPEDTLYKLDLPRQLQDLKALEDDRPRPRVFTRADQAAYEKAFQLFHAAMYDEAKTALAPLVQQFPSIGAIRALDCIVQRQSNPREALAACEAGAKAVTGSAAPTLQLAQTQLEAKDPKAAVETLRRGLTLLDGTVDDAEIAWGVAVAVSQNAQCVSWVERAAPHAQKAPEVEKAVAWARTMRRWASLPAISDDCEREHLERFRNVLRLMERDLRGAEREIGGFGPGPARDSLLCELNLRRGSLKPARAACTPAIAAYGESTHAHYLLGVIAEREHHLDEEVRELAKVVELGPENDDAWTRLAQAYAQSHDEMALKSLQARFQARFGRPLR